MRQYYPFGFAGISNSRQIQTSSSSSTSMVSRGQAGMLACICLLLGSTALAAAQEASVNPQGIIMYNIGKWLTSNDPDMLKELGWTYGGNPCTGWTGVECNAEGYVSAV